jgi:hypothetical protein
MPQDSSDRSRSWKENFGNKKSRSKVTQIARGQLMRRNGAAPAEVVGLKGLSVTLKAREIVEKAGFYVIMRNLSPSDLLYLKPSLGITRLPAVRFETGTFQGMNEIRAHFGVK